MSVRDTLPRSGADEATEAMDLSEVQKTSKKSRPKASADSEKTVIAPAAAAAADAEQTTVLPADPQTEIEVEDPTMVEDPAEARKRRRAERDKALGTRRPEPELEETEKPTQLKPKRTTDKFFGSLGLFLLRVVTAGIIGLHGFAKAMDIQAVQTMLANTVIPEPVIMSYVLAGAEVAIALALFFGLFTRLAGFGLATIGICALVFVHWIANPFVGNALTGELELMLGAVGILFLVVGGGGWSVDAAFRRRRAAEAA